MKVLKSFASFSFFLSFSWVNAQTLNIGQQLTFGGSASDVPSRTLNTSDGGFITVGKSGSGISGDKTESNRGANDFWIIKYNSSLAIQWQKTFGGTSGEGANAVAELSNGDILVCGGSASGISGDKTAANYGLDDYWLVKLTSSGAFIWDKTYGGSNSDVATSMVVDASNNIYIGGVSSSNSGAIKSENSRGGNDYWILKLDSAGTKLWDKTIGGSGGENLGAITLDNGDIVIQGISNSNISGEKSDNSFNSSTDIWMVKVNNSGTILWDKTFGGDDFEMIGNVIIANNGYYYAICSSFSGITGVKTEAARGIADIWVIKVDASGNLVWDKTLGGSGTENGINLFMSDLNQLIIFGSSDSNISGDKTENSKGLQDGWILSLDTNKTLLWQKTIGGAATDLMYSVNEIATGYYVLTLSSTSNISGDKTQNSKGSEDYWLVELVTDLSVSSIANSFNLKIYPNPAKDWINISTDDNSEALFEIYDLTSKLIKSDLLSGEYSLDISSWPNGVYFIQYRSNVVKVVIAK